MPLGLLLTLVVGGIAGIALLLHLLGHSARFDLHDAGVARAEWQRHWPGDAVSHVYLAQEAALVDTDAGPGLLRTFGADTVAHRVAEMVPARGGLRIGFAAFEAPAVQVALQPRDRDLWLQVWQEAKHG